MVTRKEQLLSLIVLTIEQANEFLKQTVFALEEIPEVQAISENFDDIVETKPKKVYIPPMTHPWKQKLFENFIEKQEHRLEKVS